MYYQIIDVNKESIGFVWKFVGKNPQIEQIYLPSQRNKLLAKIKRDHPGGNITSRKLTGDLAGQIKRLYAGKESIFSLSQFNLAKLTNFSAKVLKNICKIPRGKVTTYSSLAGKLGNPRAARAVGMALANNPFPLIMPCHRVIRADGSLGGFGGGLAMKKELLTKEGVSLNRNRRVLAKYFWK